VLQTPPCYRHHRVKDTTVLQTPPCYRHHSVTETTVLLTQPCYGHHRVTDTTVLQTTPCYEVMTQKVSLPIVIECKDWPFFLVLQLEIQLGGENMIFSSNLLSVRCSSFEDFCLFLFGSKMVLKKLEVLSASELRTELKRVGIKGKFVKAQAIMRLTTHLIDVSEDPLTFEFDPDMLIDEVSEDNPDDYVVTNDGTEGTETARNEAASVSGLTAAIFASSSTPVTLPVTATAFVSTSSACITTATVTTSSATSSMNLGQYPPATGVGNPMFHPYVFNPNQAQQFPGLAGMNFSNQYPASNLWSQAMHGMAPQTPVSPWAMYSPYGGIWTPPGPGSPGTWTPPGTAPPRPAPHSASASSSSSSGTAMINSAMADFTGACPPPARNTDTKSTKIVSGQYDSGRREVKERQNWPQVMIDHLLNPETVDYDNLNWAGLTAGMTGKILAEMDPTVTDNATINKIKHVNRLANYGMKTPMKSILNFNAVLFRAIENRALSWDNWEKIEQFHTRHLSSLTVAAATV
jgi:hypothetical protein